MTAAEVLRRAIARLRVAEVADPARDARLLLVHAMGISPDRLTLHLADIPDAAQRLAYDQAIAARATRQPVSQITGDRAFYGRSFRVTPETLDPRPDTETLIEAALARPFRRVLDLGTGTGCILLTLLAERPEATGLAVDLSVAALDVARANAEALGLAARASFKQSDWFAAVTGDFDLIVSNPPYIAASEMPGLAPEVRDWEPRLALTPGGDGLGAYRAIAAGAMAHLREEGMILVEIGPTQAVDVSALFGGAGFSDLGVGQDIDGRDRVVQARK